MPRSFRAVLITVLFGSLGGYAQVQPCATGTLANVLGTSCTIGPITFTFGNNFNGFTQTQSVNNIGHITITFFGPENIGFIPVTAGSQSGFQLVTNFVEETLGKFADSRSVASFSYGVQADDTSEITAETGTVDGSINPIAQFFATISSSDDHEFRNGSLVQVMPFETFSFFAGLSLDPTVTSTLAMPGITSGPTDPSGLAFTTQLTALADLGDEAILNSATFLYTTAPRVPTPPAGNFQFQNIDFPGAASTFADGLNNHGQIVGAYLDSQGNLHGYLQDGSNFQTIDFPNASGTFPTAISNSGAIVGEYADASGQGHGFTLIDGTFTTVDFPGSIFSSIIDINDRGDLVGIYELPGPSVHGFLQDKNGLTSIDDPDQAFVIPFTQAFGINNRENILGAFPDAAGNTHGFSLFHGAFQTIDVPGAGTTTPEGLNENNAMVGIYTDLDAVQHGYVQRSSSFSTLDFPGAIEITIVFQINDPGTVVGNYVDDQGLTHSFLADQQPDGPQNGAGKNDKAKSTPSQTCSPADWTHHPEKMRSVGRCHM